MCFSGKPLKQNITTDYSDYTYKLSGRGRPSPRLVSEKLFKKLRDETATPNARNLTAMFAFFSEYLTIHLSFFGFVTDAL